MKESCDPETKDAKILYTLSEVFQALVQLFGAIKKMLSLEINYLLRVVWIPQASPNCSCSYIYLQCWQLQNPLALQMCWHHKDFGRHKVMADWWAFTTARVHSFVWSISLVQSCSITPSITPPRWFKFKVIFWLGWSSSLNCPLKKQAFTLMLRKVKARGKIRERNLARTSVAVSLSGKVHTVVTYSRS